MTVSREAMFLSIFLEANAQNVNLITQQEYKNEISRNENKSLNGLIRFRL